MEASERVLTIALSFAILLWKSIIKGTIGVQKGKEITLAQSKHYISSTKLKKMGSMILCINWYIMRA